MDKLIPICILVVIIIIGFISKVADLSSINKRIEFTSSYREKFIKFIKKIIEEHICDNTIYQELTADVKAMQYELGEDGEYAYMTDNLRGVAVRGYQLLINFSPILCGAFIGGMWCVLVIFGAHRPILPIAINDIAQNGRQNLLAFAGAANFSQAGAAMGVFLKSKNKSLLLHGAYTHCSYQPIKT